LTQSSWSHAAIYVGDELLRGDRARARELEQIYGDEAEHLIVEAIIEGGVVASPISKYRGFHLRLCRPFGLEPGDLDVVLREIIGQMGADYDVTNLLDLARYFLPVSLVPARWRRDALAFGSGRPTEVICSSMIARAFDRVGFPVLPRTEEETAAILEAADDRGRRNGNGHAPGASSANGNGHARTAPAANGVGHAGGTGQTNGNGHPARTAGATSGGRGDDGTHARDDGHARPRRHYHVDAGAPSWPSRRPLARHLRMSRRPHTLVTPRDFDLSPYFEIVKFSLIEGTREEPRPVRATIAAGAARVAPLWRRFTRWSRPSEAPRAVDRLAQG
jgi:hypothetical protein